MARTKKADQTAKDKEDRKATLKALSEWRPEEPFDEEDPNQEKFIPRDKFKTTHGMGRPTVMTKQVLKNLEDAFRIGCPDREAVIYAEISEQTLYNYGKKHPEFLEQKEAWKEVPILKARGNVIKALHNESVGDSWQYLIRKRKAEFADMKIEAPVEAPLTVDDLEALDHGDVQVLDAKKKVTKKSKK